VLASVIGSITIAASLYIVYVLEILKLRRVRAWRERRAQAAEERRASGRTTAQPARRRGRPTIDERPPAPWGSFPLGELVILVGLVALVIGFFSHGRQGAVLLGAGFVLCALAGLELSIREHFAGYRSHTLLLAGAVGVAVLGGLLLFAPGVATAVRIAAAAAVFAAAAWLLARTFRNRSGVIFKLR
jgi:hypothetical protein